MEGRIDIPQWWGLVIERVEWICWVLLFPGGMNLLSVAFSTLFCNQTSPLWYVNSTFHFAPFGSLRNVGLDKFSPYFLINFFGIIYKLRIFGQFYMQMKCKLCKIKTHQVTCFPNSQINTLAGWSSYIYIVLSKLNKLQLANQVYVS